jgi:phage terminase large subunit-like protein
VEHSRNRHRRLRAGPARRGSGSGFDERIIAAGVAADLSRQPDITSVATVIEMPDGRLAPRVQSFCPQQRIRRPAVNAFERAMFERKLGHGNNPFVRWAVSNVVLLAYAIYPGFAKFHSPFQ